jgi:hypothetical protein
MSPPFYSLFFNVFNSIFCNSLLILQPSLDWIGPLFSLMFAFQKLINLCPVQTFRMRRSLPAFVRNSYVPEWQAQVGIHCAFGQLRVCVYIQECPLEIRTPADWNLLDRSLTVPPPVLSPSSTLPPAASCFYCRRGKFGAFQRCLNCWLLFTIAEVCNRLFWNCATRGVSVLG